MVYRKTDNPYYKHPLYRTWKNIRNRCNNPNNPKYHRYGARGIKVCQRWDNFDLFLQDMGDKPSYDMHEGTVVPIWSVGRIDNDGDYEPSNCRWELLAEQSRNRSTNVHITHEGKEYYLSDLREKYGISSGAYYSRIYGGWDRLTAATTPTRPPRTKSTNV